MTDARWIEGNSDLAAAVEHYGKAIGLYRAGGFDAPDLDGYRSAMALMHSLQSAHTSLEGALLRILEMLGEERPVGENWHADLIKRVAMPRPGKRPAILPTHLAASADETRRFRHRATHNYDSFRVDECARTISAAELLRDHLQTAIAEFQIIIDPPA